MSKRMIDASVWRSENFASLPPMARLLLMGMITTADDQGRLSANPKFLRGDFFAYDEEVKTADIQEWLIAIASNETIILYTVDGKQYAQLANWWKYQSLQYAMPSKFPKPDGWLDRIRYNFTKGAPLTYNWFLTDGTKSPDTCDENGFPINVKILGGSSGGDGQSGLSETENNQVDNQVDSQVAIQEEDKEEEYITTKDSNESLQTSSDVAPPEPVSENQPEEPQHLPQPPLKAEFAEEVSPPVKPAKEKKTSDPRVKKIIEAFITARGSNKGINYAQEGVFAKKILSDYGTDDYETLVIETFQWLKKDDFWKTKPVGLSTVFKNIESYLRYKNRGGSSVNASNNNALLRVGHVELEWDESKFRDINF